MSLLCFVLFCFISVAAFKRISGDESRKVYKATILWNKWYIKYLLWEIDILKILYFFHIKVMLVATLSLLWNDLFRSVLFFKILFLLFVFLFLRGDFLEIAITSLWMKQKQKPVTCKHEIFDGQVRPTLLSFEKIFTSNIQLWISNASQTL